MSQYVATRTKTFTTSEAIPANALVKLDAAWISGSFSEGIVSIADSKDYPIGVACEYAPVGKPVSVVLLNATGTVKMIANDITNIGTILYGCDDGKVNDTDPSGGIKVGRTLEAAANDGDIIEVIPFLAQA